MDIKEMLGYRFPALLRIKKISQKYNGNENDTLEIYYKVLRNNSLYMLAIPVAGKLAGDIS